jgi:uncharacterized protein
MSNLSGLPAANPRSEPRACRPWGVLLEGLRFDQVEKDYVILCVLSALVRAGVNDAGWTFKGGTCLRHCYYPGHRFSEDIDFSCRSGDDNVANAARLIETAAGLVSVGTGMATDVRAAVQSPGQQQLEIPLHYSRGGTRRQALPAVRVQLTFDEPVLSGAESRTVVPIYSGLEPFQITAHSLLEIAAEKLRALLQVAGGRVHSRANRCSPRDGRRDGF